MRKQKGFTLVELLVVIAILAILATVSIVGYTAFTKKATISNDESLCAQMNLILQSSEVEEKAKSFSDVVDIMKENGLILANMNPTTEEYYFVWDSELNRMLLVDENLKVTFPEDKTSETIDDTWYFAVKDVADKNALTSNATYTNASNKPNVIYAPEEYTVLLNDFNDETTGVGKVGGEVILANDINVDIASADNRITIETNEADTVVNFNLSGSTIKSEGTTGWNGARAMNIKKGYVNLSDGSIISDEQSYGGLYMTGGTLKATNMYFSNNKATGLAVKICGGQATLENVTIETKKGACTGIDGDTEGVSLTIKSGTFNQSECVNWCSGCIYVGYDMTLTLDGGDYTCDGGYSVFVVPSSNSHFIVNGGTYTAKGTHTAVSESYSGTETLLFADCKDSKNPNLSHTIIINDGVFYGKVHLDEINKSSITINGGTFNGVSFTELASGSYNTWEDLIVDYNYNNGNPNYKIEISADKTQIVISR